MSRVLMWLRKVVEYFAYVMILLMTLIICWQVFSRFVLGVTPAWILELSLLLFVWIGFLGIAIGIQDNSHIQITLFIKKLPPKLRKLVYYVQRILAMILSMFLTIEGWKFADSMKNSQIPGLQISSAWTYLILPISGILVIIYLLAEFAGKWKAVSESEEEI